ncbi:hypothetical protein FRC11_000120 [Ceratobasidium sp. 423]|nr:hypothetical protein FRC11_000120 [Ceratobasidium sp. 423]
MALSLSSTVRLCSGAIMPVIGLGVYQNYDAKTSALLAFKHGYRWALSMPSEARYEAYIKAVASQLRRYPHVSVAIALEPDSIGNLVTNLSVPKCGNAAPAHKRLLGLAVVLLQLPNVSLYLDGAHAGWLGWPDNLAPTAAILGEILNNAKTHNAKATVRGLATNVSNYNGLGNQEQQGRDELKTKADPEIKRQLAMVVTGATSW